MPLRKKARPNLGVPTVIPANYTTNSSIINLYAKNGESGPELIPDNNFGNAIIISRIL